MLTLAVELALVRAAHVLAVIVWIGGVAFVTTVLLPAVARDHPPERRLAAFLRIETRFAWQARLSVLTAGGSGLWMTWRLDAWSRFADPTFWWMHAMAAVWLAFSLMLFVLEPLVLHRLLDNSPRPDLAFRRVVFLHWILLAASLLAVGGAVAGAHGL